MADAYLLHQVHPAKLATDLAAGIISTAMIWQHRVPAALIAGFLPPAVASAVLLRRDLEWLRMTRSGRYVLVQMPPLAQAIRLAGQVVVWGSAYRRSAPGVALGHLIIAAGWGRGLWRSPGRADAPRRPDHHNAGPIK